MPTIEPETPSQEPKKVEETLPSLLTRPVVVWQRSDADHAMFEVKSCKGMQEIPVQATAQIKPLAIKPSIKHTERKTKCY